MTTLPFMIEGFSRIITAGWHDMEALLISLRPPAP
jgi:hypothetical protein